MSISKSQQSSSSPSAPPRGGIASFQMPRVAQWLSSSALDIEANTKQSQGNSSVGKLKKDGLAKKLLLRQFNSMSRGYLLLKENGEKQAYGNLLSLEQGFAKAEIVVNDEAVYQRMLINGVLGAAEGYMEGEWTTPDLLSVIRFFVSNLNELQEINRKRSWFNRAALASLSWINRNTLQRSKKNICAHYDLGNDFFSLFLDPTLLYSAAIFSDEDMTLEQASIAKLDRLCRKLELKPQDHLLEIGTGWGAMAVYAAEIYGCSVTTTTISEEQYNYATQLVKEKGLQNRVTVLKKDYRALEGTYDKLVSVEMIEAVGHQYYQQYFSHCSKLLKPSGLMAIQAITIPDQRYKLAQKSVDFIKRYVFPGGCLPSLSVIANHVRQDTDMVLSDVFDITEDYAKTLSVWRESFFSKIEDVRALGFDQRFINMWEYYLCYCEGGFRERVIGTHQIVMAKPDYRKV